MSLLLTIVFIIIFLFIAAIIGYVIWYYVWGPGKRKSVHLPPTYHGPAYANPIWSESIDNSMINGFNATTSYDNSSTTAPACSTSIQSAAKANNDSTVVGWSWSNSSSLPNSCRAITTTNLTKPCITPVIAPAQGYVGKTAVNYYSLNQCSK